MSVERWWNGDDRENWSDGGMVMTGKTKVLRGKPLSMPVCPPKFPSELALDQIVQCQKNL